jgi:DNA-binding CsgD family transcriptional regulator/tetratricopeptide (TPR) repeat protein
VRVAESTNDGRYPLLAAALTGVLAFQGEIQRARDLVERLLASQRADPAVRSLALAMLVNVLNDSGEYSRARESAEQSLQLARQVGSTTLVVKALSTLSDSYRRLGDVSATVALHRELVALLRRSGQPVALADQLNGLAWALIVSGQPPAAEEAAAEALAILGTRDAPYSVASTAHTAGTVAVMRDHLDQASVYFAAGLLAPIWVAYPVICNVDGFALVAARGGRPERALRLFAAASAARTNLGAVNDGWWQRQCDDAAGLARDQLSGSRASAVVAEGAALTLAEAVAYALTDGWPPASRPGRTSALTRRERQVAELVAEGATNLQIGARLGVSAGTVATHLKSIRARLGLSTRAHIAAWATRQPSAGQPSPVVDRSGTAGGQRG